MVSNTGRGGGAGGLLQEGGSALYHNFASMKAMKMRLEVKIGRPKMFPLRSATRRDDVI